MSQLISQPSWRVAIIGATNVGRRIAENWLRNGAHVTVIERSLNTANDLSGSDIGAHANSDVIHGDFLDGIFSQRLE